MIKKLRSGKFWLKLTFFSSLAWLMVMSLGYAISVWGLTDARIRASLEEAMPTGRTVTFDAISARDWLPYPSVTLNHVRISYPGQTPAQLTSQQLTIDLGWKSLFGYVEIQRLRLLQPQLNVARLADNSWDIDDFYGQTASTKAINDIEIIDGLLNVRESNHQYTLSAINAALNNWQAPQSDVRLAFDWPSLIAGKQQVNVLAKIQKNSTGFSSDHVTVKINNQLPTLGKISWQAQGKFQHIWQEHSSQFQDVTLSGSDEQGWFKANLSIPDARWRGSWRLPQINGLIQWQHPKQQLLTASLKVGATEISSQYFKTSNSSLDILYKQAKETLSIKAAGSAAIHNTGEFMFNNWQISSRQTDANLQTDALFRSAGVANAFGNINGRWSAYWDGSFDGESTKIELMAADANTVELGITAQRLDLERYQNWLRSNETATPNSKLDAEPNTAGDGKNFTTPSNTLSPWLARWQQLPRSWQLTGKVDVGELITTQMQVRQFHADINLNRQALNINNIKAVAYDGTVAATLVIPRADEQENILQVNIQDVDVQPWLEHWQTYNRFSGHGSMVLYLTARGKNWDNIRHQLNGELGFELKNGRFHGFALEGLLNKTGNTNVQLKLDDAAQTDFDVLKSHSKIQNGVFNTDVVDLDTPTGLKLSGQGKYHLPNNKLDYQLIFSPRKLDNAALPIRITGPILQPNFSLDYQSLTKGLTNPTDKSNAVRDVLTRQWQLWQMPELPLTTP